MNIGTREEQYRHYQAYNSRPEERKLSASELAVLKGIENIPPDAKLVFTTDSTPTLVAPQGQFFTWGPFQLKEMELDHTFIRFYKRHFFGERNKYADIHGIQCKLDSHLDLTRKNQTSGYQFDDFRVSSCGAKGIGFYLEGQKLPLEDTYVSFYAAAKEIIFNVPKDILPADQPLMSAYLDSLSPLFLLDNRQDIVDITNVVADMNGQALILFLRVKYPTNSGSTAQTQIGKCSYLPGTEIYGVNFKDGSADWFFMPHDISGLEKTSSLADECKMQRLPYRLKA
ncbi:hypothetical protein HYE66_10555 [Aggregatibacter actinomycetemcomitans]|nr:hypothetical protein [Aggregatibacter actinomycetemcomitans]